MGDEPCNPYLPHTPLNKALGSTEQSDVETKNPNEIDNGEYISLNMLQEQYKNDTYKLFPRILSVSQSR